MATWVVDKSLDVLLRQINEAAPNRSKDSDGSIGDAAHSARTSAHNPQATADSSDRNDPDGQVDARDFTHDPANGADMHQITEALRQSRDRRIQLVIFNGRQFSSYTRDGIPPFTWRPYAGTNQHTKHAHVETNDLFNDDLTPWEIGVSAQSDDIIVRWSRGYDTRTDGVSIEPVKWRKRDEAWQTSTDAALAELKEMLKAQAEQILALASALNALNVPAPAPVDPAVLRPVVEDGVRAVLRDGVGQA